jgi:hypothetical protein
MAGGLIELTPNSGVGFAVRGLSEFETGDYQQSLQDIQQGLALGAGNDPRYESILRYHEVLPFTWNGEVRKCPFKRNSTRFRQISVSFRPKTYQPSADNVIVPGRL